MALDSVAPVGTGSSSQINQQDFLRILLTQLNAQNPLKPMDNTTFVAQMAQFSQLESSQQMTSSLNKLVSVETASQSMALLGRTVNVLNGFGFTSGQVTNVSVSGSTPVMTVKPATGTELTNVERSKIYDIK